MNNKFKVFLVAAFAVVLVGGIAAGAYFVGTMKDDSTGTASDTDSGQDTDIKNPEASEDAVDPESLDYNEFTSEDGLITVKYPSSWIKSEVEDPSQTVSEDTLEKYDLKIPFIATAPETEELAQLVVTEMTLSSTELPADIFEEMVQESSGTGTEIEILRQNQFDDNILFEAEYTINNLTIRSKEVMLLFPPEKNSRTGYVISFQTELTDWDKYSEFADYIIDPQISD